MNELTHVVRRGDSPELIAKQYGVYWQTIREHPRNAFVRRRTGYPIQPGDKLTVPKVNVRTKFEFLQSLRMLETNLETMLTLQRLHPSARAVREHAHAPPTPKPGVRVSSVTAPVAYEKRLVGVANGVKLTAAIESAFVVLKPLLPVTVVMTSGYRSHADQERVIENRYKKHGGPASIADIEQRRQWLLELDVEDSRGKKTKLRIARVGKSPHLTGRAFDLSGADLITIDNIVHRCAKEEPESFPLKSTIVEKGQNCVHVNLRE